MPSLRIPRPVSAQILPEDGISLDRLKGDALARLMRCLPPLPLVVVVLALALAIVFNTLCILDVPRILVAFHEAAPLILPSWHAHPWEVCATARAVIAKIYHERAYPVAAQG